MEEEKKEDEGIIFELDGTQSVKAGTLVKLVEHLTPPSGLFGILY